MISALRDYQQDLYIRTRESLRKNRAVCVQSATGSGKSIIFSAMCDSVYGKKKTAWILVTRKELIKQSSEHLLKWNVPHGIIAPNMQESKAYQIHVVSSDTLIRRFDRIKHFPDLLIIDEAHLMLDRQLKIESYLPEHTKIVGFTATPQRGDNRGLARSAGGIYDDLIEGLSIPELTRQGFLAPLKYFAPPLEGLDKLHFRGTEVDAEELELLLERRKIYGAVVEHYSKHGRGRSALIFCRSVKSAEHTAERFRDQGYKFYNIDGTMSIRKRYELVNALKNGTIEGLVGCDIFIYGLDFPRVSYGATLRPTKSRALYMQAIGRILRPFIDPITGFKKQDALFFDHCNNILEHQDDNYPGIPLHYVPQISWNFFGSENPKKEKDKNNIKLCPLLDFFYCARPTCAGCKYNKDKNIVDQRKPMLVVNTDLKEVQKPISLADRPYEERREIQDRIGAAVLEYNKDQSLKAVEELCKIADSLGYSVFWVYHKLNDDSKLAINVPLLAAIGKCKNYKPGWPYYAKQKIRIANKDKEEYREVMAQ